jgi:hypothetical protein
MPLQDDTPYCLNHKDTQLRRNEGLNALNTFLDTASGYSFDMSRGVPVVMYVCPKCGYVEMYAAQISANLPFSSAPRDKKLKRRDRPILTGLNFERAVLAALQHGSPLFRNAITMSQIRVGRVREREIDAVIMYGPYVFVAEIKAVTSPSLVHEAAHKVIESTEMYSATLLGPDHRQARAVLIVPSEAKVHEEELHGVLLLRFDQELGDFVHPIPSEILALQSG